MAVTVIGAGMVEAVEVAMEGGEDKLAIVKTFRTEGKGEWMIPAQFQVLSEGEKEELVRQGAAAYDILEIHIPHSDLRLVPVPVR